MPLEKMSDGTEVEYQIYPLVDKYDDVLHTVTPEFNFESLSVNPASLAVGLIRTMMQHGGVGLAAPQCGLLHRVFVMGAPNGQGYACFNPKVISTTGMVSFEEGCLSFKGMYLKINRPDTIEVEYQDMLGKIHRETFGGLTARTFLHELDHLNGIVYTSLVDRYTLDKAKSKVKTNLKKLERQRQAHAKQQIINQAMQKVIEERRVAELEKQINLSIPDLKIEIPSYESMNIDLLGTAPLGG
jgi:peptide deformylase